MSLISSISGDRFTVQYLLTGSDIERRSNALCIEQTIEFPPDLVEPGPILDHIVGKVTNIEVVSENKTRVSVSYAVETTGFELNQFLNVIFGNSSLLPDIRVEHLVLPDSFLSSFAGPRFGIEGIRHLTGRYNKPLLCTALKPMGRSPLELASNAYDFALGGIDIIKDDHGLADQSFCSFRERISRCADAIHQANGVTGRKCLYAPNVTGPVDQLHERVQHAIASGSTALLVAPGIIGFDSTRHLSTYNVPVLAHPALLGSLVTSPNTGMSHHLVFGIIQRLSGADISIFPNSGGRFGFSADECTKIAAACCSPLGSLASIFPAPAGGMSLVKVPEMISTYGNDVALLVGGDLHRHSVSLVHSVHQFRAHLDKL